MRKKDDSETMVHPVEKDSASQFWIAACLIGSFACLSLYFRDLESASLLASRGKKIGFVEEMDQDVQRRPNDRMLWVNVLPKRPIFEFDTIKTGPDSSAFITLNENQGSFRVSPNSLVVLDTSQNELEIRLASGDLFLKGKVKAKVGDRLIAASTDSEVKVARRTETGQLAIEVKEGAALIEGTNGEKTKLESGSQFMEEKGAAPRVSVLPVKILAPEPAQSQRLKAGEKLRFVFEGVTEHAEFKLHLELSKTPEFSGRVLNFPLVADTEELAVPPGAWFARVVETQSNQVQSSLTQFTLKLRPQILWDGATGGEFAGLISNETTKFAIQWNAVEDAANYEIEFRRGEKSLLKKLITQNRLTEKDLESKFVDSISGLEGWKKNPSLELSLRAFDINGNSLSDPALGKLRFNDGRVSPSPTALSLVLDPADPLKAKLSWTHAPTSDVLHFEVNDHTRTTQVTGTEIVLDSAKLFQASQSDLEIRSLGENGTSSPWIKLSYDRAPFEFASLVKLKPTILYPSNGTRILKASVSRTTLEWQLPKTEFLELDHVAVKIESRSSKSSARTLQSKTNTISLPALSPGDYLVSVQPFWKGKGPSAPSENREFSVIKGARLMAPQLRRPAGNGP